MELIITTDTPVSKMDNFSNYLSVITKEDALESVRRLTQMESEDWFRVGMILSSYKKTKGEKELSELLSYTSDNFQINSRKAFYLINIYDRLVASNITPDKVADVGWTKLKEIADLLTPDNVDYWVDICKKHTTQQLITLLKSNGTTNEKKATAIATALDATPTTPNDAPTDAPTDSHTDSSMVIGGVIKGTLVDPTCAELVSTVEIPDTEVPTVEVSQEGVSGSFIGAVSDYQFTPSAKYTSNFVPPDSTYADNSLAIVEGVSISETFDPDVALETPIELIKQDTSSNYMLDLINRLKDYELNTVIKTVTDIFPHIKIIVTEPQDETSFD